MWICHSIVLTPNSVARLKIKSSFTLDVSSRIYSDERNKKRINFDLAIFERCYASHRTYEKDSSPDLFLKQSTGYIPMTSTGLPAPHYGAYRLKSGQNQISRDLTNIKKLFKRQFKVKLMLIRGKLFILTRC